MKSRSLAPLLAFTIASLGSCSSPTPTPSGPTWTLESPEYVLAPGQERFVCTSANLPSDRDAVITAMSPQYGAGTHHVFFGQALAPEPAGTYECDTLFRTTWLPLYLGGVRSTELRLPSGTGIRVPAGQQVFIQLHLQNTTAATIRARTSITLSLATAEQNVRPAGIFGLDNRVLRIPSRATNHRTAMSCRPNRDMTVFAVLGHMHKFGSRIEFVRGGIDSSSSLFSAAWTFGEQPTTPVSFSLTRADEVSLRCFHSNPTAREVTYGESSDQEMCAVVMYYTPFDALDGCIEDGVARDAGTTRPDVPVGDGGVPLGSCSQPGDMGNANGVGRFCTPTGRECAGQPASLCLATLAPTEGQWFCTNLCTSDAQCGADARCQGDTRGRVCVPRRCAGESSDGGTDAGVDGPRG